MEKPDLTIGAIKSVTAAGLYIAQQNGYFASEGLHLTINSTTGSGPAMADLIRGSLDVNFGAYVPFILAQAKGVAKLHILAEGNNAARREQELVVMPDSPIKTVADLKGKIIGTNAPKTESELVISSLLTENGLPATAVKYVYNPFPVIPTLLAKGSIDAAWLVDPFLSDAELKYGVRVVADGDQGATTNFPIAGYVTTAEWVTKYPKTAAAFIRALNRGQTAASTDRPALEKALEQFIGITPRIAAVVTAGDFPTGVDQVRMQRIADTMHQFGYLSKSFNITPMVS